ncbi:MAG: histidine kinase N-terminal domain-containing protein [Gemmatimonadota bacterium]
MRTRIRDFDWSRSPLGPMERWPQSLQVALRIMLDSRYAMWLGWGPDFVFFYNDAYAEMTLGPKHPWALGRPACDVWSEIWDEVGPRAESVMRTGQATWDERLLLFLERRGFVEESYHTFSYSPIPDDGDSIGGMLCVVTEDTERTIGERRLRTLRELAARTTDEVKSADEACQVAASTLAENGADLPFVLIYLVDGDSARLAGEAGLPSGSTAAPAVLELSGERHGVAVWPLSAVQASGRPVVVRDLASKFGALPSGAWSESPERAVVLPVSKPGQPQLAGFVVAAVSPRLALDDEYLGFLELIAGHVAACVNNARAYEEERRRSESLAELDRAKTTFFSNVSHEFRTPLALMLGPVEALLSRGAEELTPAVMEELALVNRNGGRLLRLVNTLLDFSRIEAGRIHAVYQETDLAAFTADLASVFRSACERAGLRLTVECQPLESSAFVDRDMWEKIVLNLLSNAFKFTFEGEIAVSLGTVDASAQLTVRDSGVGIAEEEMPRLFERFHRIENARGRTHEGSGIGLALVQELVRLHGGTVTAQSEFGDGTTFTVRIPLGSDHLPAAAVAASEPGAPSAAGALPYLDEALRWLPESLPPAGAGARTLAEEDKSERTDVGAAEATTVSDARPRVLVVDDNSDMRQYIVRLLRECYQVDMAADGAAALEMMRLRRPDLVLSDVMMPRLDGFGLLRAVRAEPRLATIPVILISARAGDESRVEGVEAGADDYLIKPFSARELLARVNAQLQMSRMRRDAIDALRRSEEHLRLVTDNAPVLIAHFDAERRFKFVNAAHTQFFGLPPAEVIGRPVRDVVGAAAYAKIESHVDAALDGHSVVFEIDVPSEHGDLQVMRGAYTPERDGDDVIGVVAALINITAQRTAEERERAVLAQAADANAKFRAYFDQGALFAWIMDIDGTIREPNRLASEWCGYSREENVGKPFWEGPWWTPSPGLVAQVRDGSMQAARGEPFRAELPYFVADGSERTVDVSIVPIRDPDGRVLFLAPTGNDITERKRAESALRQKVEEMSTLLDTLPIAVFLAHDAAASSISGNAAAHLLLRTGRSNLSMSAPDDERPRHFRVFQDGVELAPEEMPVQRAARGEQVRNVEVEDRFDDGTVLHTLMSAAPLFDDAGRARGAIATVLDVTERKRSLEALQDSDRRKTEFLATLAHELRNPLAPLLNGLQLMRVAATDDALVDKARTMMERQLAQLVRLVDDLLDVSRISQGKLALRTEPVELTAVLASAVETSRPLIDQMQQTLRVDVPDEPIVVDADLTRMAQVFMNLLNNAAKYSEPGGQIEVAVTCDPREVAVSVRDSGIGIAPEQLPLIFDMFSQVEHSIERSRGGLGIGLSLVQRLVEMHGGRIEARSEGVGRGSEFVVHLPRIGNSLSASVDRRTDQRPDAAFARAPRRVLVVDDNHDGADTLQMILELAGYETCVAHDGLDALAKVARFRPDVLLLDIGLPRMNGYDVCRRVRESLCGDAMVIIALTGWGQDDDRVRSRDAGFDHHLVKPVDPASLLTLLVSSVAR